MLKVNFQKQLDHFNLEMQFELNIEILALVGSSGSGKTTLLNCLAGIVHPDNGTILLNGRHFYKEGQKPLKIQKRKVGYLFQDYALFPHLTAEQNILYAPFSALDDANRDRCQEELLRIHEQWQIPIIFVTHRIADAEKLADRIIRVEKGQMAEEAVV